MMPTTVKDAYARVGKRCAFIGHRSCAETLLLLDVTLTSGRSRRNLRLLATSWNPRRRKATPFFKRHGSDGHQCELANHESHEPRKRLLHETVGMQAHAEHVHAEPRET